MNDAKGLQHERTALAWERTAISLMAAGLLLARYSSDDGHRVLAMVGLVHTAGGAAMLLWTGYKYELLHGPIAAGEDVVHPVAARLVGLVTVSLTAWGLLLAVVLTLD